MTSPADTATTPLTMKALEFVRKTGDIKVVTIPTPVLPLEATADIRVPPPSVVVQVEYAAIDTALEAVRDSHWLGWILHSTKPPLYLGWHYSGIVQESTSRESHPVGARVFGFLEYSASTQQGTFAEYIQVPAESCGLVPEGLGMDVAAAAGTECMTALMALRDCAGLKPPSTNEQENKNNKETAVRPEHVLILGAAGGVGSAAVGIAKCLGAKKVTAICSEKDVARVRDELQPDYVINRSTVTANNKDPIVEAATSEGGPFDIIFDCPSLYAPGKYWKCFGPKGGTFVATQPSLGLVWGMLCSLVSSSCKARMVMCKPIGSDLTKAAKWIQDGKVKIWIDSTFNVADMKSAMERQANPTKSGRVVIKVHGGWNEAKNEEKK